MLDIFVHQLLVLAVFVAGLIAFLEFLLRNNVTVELLRTTFILLQGSWFWQVSWGLQLMYLVFVPIIFSLWGDILLCNPETSF